MAIVFSPTPLDFVTDFRDSEVYTSVLICHVENLEITAANIYPKKNLVRWASNFDIGQGSKRGSHFEGIFNQLRSKSR